MCGINDFKLFYIVLLNTCALLPYVETEYENTTQREVVEDEQCEAQEYTFAAMEKS